MRHGLLILAGGVRGETSSLFCEVNILINRNYLKSGQRGQAGVIVLFFGKFLLINFSQIPHIKLSFYRLDLFCCMKIQYILAESSHTIYIHVFLCTLE